LYILKDCDEKMCYVLYNVMPKKRKHTNLSGLESTLEFYLPQQIKSKPRLELNMTYQTQIVFAKTNN